MFIHTVYFWLRNDLSPDDRRTFADGVHALTAIETVDRAYIGVPAPTDRPAIDRSYSYALVVIFKDQTAHDRYQDHPVHDRFREECGTFWTRVQIYDSVEQ